MTSPSNVPNTGSKLSRLVKGHESSVSATLVFYQRVELLLTLPFEMNRYIINTDRQGDVNMCICIHMRAASRCEVMQCAMRTMCDVRMM